MRRLFYQTKMYDYTTMKEAIKHIKEMQEKGWEVKEDIYENGQEEFKYTVEFQKYKQGGV